MTDTLELEIAIKKSGFTKRKLAEKLGISLQAFYNKLNNETEFKVSEIIKICKLLNLSNKSKEKIFFAKYVDIKST